jgi:hypothetical protein
MKMHKHPIITTALVLGTVTGIQAQSETKTIEGNSADPAVEKVVATDAAADSGDKEASSWWPDKIPDAISKGTLHFNARYRYEYADESGLKDSNANTVRTRLGYETAPLYGFRGMLEFEDVTVIGNKDNYNQAGLNSGGAGRTVVADPDGTEINQAWLAYENYETEGKFGRQRIIYDNSRFVGNVGWRQNEQTFDAFRLTNQSFKDIVLNYGYINNVNRVLGDDHPAGDWDSNSHLFNGSYAGCPYAKITGYSYLLDLDDSPVNSSATYGLSLDGSYTIDEEKNAKLNYRGEYAYQTDYKDQPVDYDAYYFRAEVGGTYDRFNAGAGYEVLSGDNGQGFSTPLATLHAFNGWADVFLNTPGSGLQDIFVWAGVKLPGNIPLKVVYHKFDSDRGNSDYGQEIDAVVSRKFGKHWTLLGKYAYYDGKDAPFTGSAVDVHKGWVQLEFAY